MKFFIKGKDQLDINVSPEKGNWSISTSNIQSSLRIDEKGLQKVGNLVPAVQGSKVIRGEEVSIFCIFLCISEGKFAIYFCCGRGSKVYFAALVETADYINTDNFRAVNSLEYDCPYHPPSPSPFPSPIPNPHLHPQFNPMVA